MAKRPKKGKRYTKKYWSEVLHREYVNNQKTISVIIIEYGASRTTISKYLKLVGIKKRKRGNWMIGRKLSDETKRKISKGLRGKKHTEETKKKVVAALIGRKWTESQREKYTKSYKSNPKNYGKTPWNWQGKSSEEVRIRHSTKYKDWRLAVYTKDGFACVGCGDNKGHNLQAHHIMSFADYPDLRFDVSNGVTLCKQCHAKLHPKLKNYILSGA